MTDNDNTTGNPPSKVPTPSKPIPLELVSEKQIKAFWSKVTKQEDGCWLWQGYTTSKGYGSIGFGCEGKSVRVAAHRFAYVLEKGNHDPSLVLDHLCRQRSCVNPDHLELVTNYENWRRGEGQAAKNLRKTHCINGHLLEGENLTPSGLKRGVRQCRTCNNERSHRLYIPKPARTHCDNNHPLEPGNLVKSAADRGWKVCSICAKVKARDRYNRSKELNSSPANGTRVHNNSGT